MVLIRENNELLLLKIMRIKAHFHFANCLDDSAKFRVIMIKSNFYLRKVISGNFMVRLNVAQVNLFCENCRVMESIFYLICFFFEYVFCFTSCIFF